MSRGTIRMRADYRTVSQADQERRKGASLLSGTVRNVTFLDDACGVSSSECVRSESSSQPGSRREYSASLHDVGYGYENRVAGAVLCNAQ